MVTFTEAQLLAWLAPDADRSRWEPSWEPLEAATLAGRFTGGTTITLTIELVVDPATGGERRALLLANLQRYFDEHWSAGGATVRPSSQGATLDLVLDELPQRIEKLHGAGEARAAEAGR